MGHLRIAFASCFCTTVSASQPVWNRIAAEQPHHLILLGDSIYLDIGAATRPQDMDSLSFAHWLVDRYQAQLAVKSFKALVQGMPDDGRVHSIWDDHDFLWNDACGAQIAEQPGQADKIAISTAAQALWRERLYSRMSGPDFPTNGEDARLWPAKPKPLATPSLELQPGLWLHLSDGRTARTASSIFGPARRSLLGKAQRDRIAKVYAKSADDSVHLFASGSTFAGYKRYEEDSAWMLAQAATRRTLMLSGDIHRNEFDTFQTEGFPMHEATSSGAAVKLAVVIGSSRENYGVLDIDEASVSVRLIDKGGNEQRRVFDRRTWLQAGG